MCMSVYLVGVVLLMGLVVPTQVGTTSVSITQVPTSPCTGIFNYEMIDGIYVGKISLPSAGLGEHVVRVGLSLKAKLFTPYKGEIEFHGTSGNRSELTVLFPLESFLQNQLPKVSSISQDGKIYCRGERERIDRAEQTVYDYQLVKKFTNVLPSSYPCGIPHPAAGNLVVNGERTAPGDWPWLVTVNLRRDAEYLCTGTMVSPNVVITAVHCVFNGATKRRADEMLLEFGVHDRIIERNNVVQKNVSSIHLPNGHTVKSPPIHDLAALVTDGPVTYTNTIIPVCLWSGDRDLQKIITSKERGSVLGWGRDEQDDDATTDPRYIKLPIVPFNICTKSHKYFNNIVRGRQYCAGTGDGRSGVCLGDGGGGMFFYRNNHWELKGVLSFAVSSESHSCDLNEYVVFTDVTHPEYKSWLTNIIDAHSGTQAAVDEEDEY